MQNNNIVRFFIVVFVLMFFSLNTFASEIINKLNSVKVEPSGKDEYSLNLYFGKNYQEKAFLQKKEDGVYFVFLPNTEIVKNPKVTYKNSSDSSKIKLAIEGKTALKGNSDFYYTRITAKMDNDYALKLISKKSDNWNWLKIIGCMLVLFMVAKICRSLSRQNSFSPARVYVRMPEIREIKQNVISSNPPMNKIPSVILPKTVKPKPFKYADKSSFDCFDIPFNKEDNNTAYEFKSMLKQTASLVKDNISPVTCRHTNPINKVIEEEKSDLSIPFVEDIATEIKKASDKQKKSQETQSPQVLSVLTLAQNKGFYLTNLEDDTIALLGYVNNNIFLFNKFKDLSQINLQARFYDKSGDNDIYIVRLDSFKAMVEISDTGMKELARL